MEVYFMSKKNSSHVAMVACVAGMFSFCQGMEEKKGFPSFTAFFPEAISLHKDMVMLESEAEAYAGVINMLRAAEEKPSLETLSVFRSVLESWEEKDALLATLETKFENQYRDFIPGKTKIITPDEEARKRALKIQALKAQEALLLKIKYPARIECLFPFVIFKTDEKRQALYRSILETVQTESNMALLKGENEGRISFEKLYSIIPSRVELSKCLSFLSGAGKKACMEKLDNEERENRFNHLALSLYQGDKDATHIRWKVKTVNR
jgi:hypothetical protein